MARDNPEYFPPHHPLPPSHFLFEVLVATGKSLCLVNIVKNVQKYANEIIEDGSPKWLIKFTILIQNLKINIFAHFYTVLTIIFVILLSFRICPSYSAPSRSFGNRLCFLLQVVETTTDVVVASSTSNKR
jgi:hypothetical protein